MFEEFDDCDVWWWVILFVYGVLIILCFCWFEGMCGVGVWGCVLIVGL